MKHDKDVDIRVGDTCYLKSGSPMLVVEFVTPIALQVRWIAYNTGVPHKMEASIGCFHNFRR